MQPMLDSLNGTNILIPVGFAACRSRASLLTLSARTVGGSRRAGPVRRGRSGEGQRAYA